MKGAQQNRALKITSLFTGFNDVTPAKSDAYSELISVNNHGIAVGYLGIRVRSMEVENRMMTIDLSTE